MNTTNKTNKTTVSSSTGSIRPPKKKPTDKCNAWARDHYCDNPAGLGTGKGYGHRCKFHGGLSTGRPKKNFSVSEYINSDLIRTLSEVSSDDPSALINLDNEINLVKTGLFQYAKDCINGKEDKKGDMVKTELSASTVSSFVGALTKLVDMKAKLEGKINQQRVPMEIIVMYVNQVTSVLKKFCPPDQLKRISSAMKEIKLDGLTNGSKSQETDSTRLI